MNKITVTSSIMILFLKSHVANSKEISYSKDIHPIFEERCSVCHNPGWAEKNWLDYDTAFKNKDKIKIRIKAETMPPGNITEVTKEERKTIIEWVDGGGKK
jgi:uncharacterized membrane protein